MTLRELHQQIGQLQQEARQCAQRLEILDRVAEAWLHPQQGAAKREAATIRAGLSALYKRLHTLEARIPTPETLSAAAYHRMIQLGFEIDAAEAARVQTYRDAHREQSMRLAA